MDLRLPSILFNLFLKLAIKNLEGNEHQRLIIEYKKIRPICENLIRIYKYNLKRTIKKLIETRKIVSLTSIESKTKDLNHVK